MEIGWAMQNDSTGKGFFTIKLDNEQDQGYVKDGKWEVRHQELRIRNWIPNFRPENHRTSCENIWIHLPGLSLEYWDEQTLFTICKALDTPVKVDEDTLNFESVLYARGLVNIDLARKVPHKLWVKTKFGGHFQSECRVKQVSHETSNQKNNMSSPLFGSSPIKSRDKFESQKAQEVGKSSNIPPTPAIGEKFDICPPPSQIQQPSTIFIKQTILRLLLFLRVLRRSRAQNKLWSLINQFHPSLVFVAELKVVCSASFCNKLNLPGIQNKVIHNSVGNQKGNIWLFWNKTLPEPTVISMSSQMITVSIGGVLVSGIHARVGVVQRRFLCSEMELISDLKQPWLAIGDFNSIVSSEEKIGGRAANRRVMQ
ncbi:uncharacterized protein LOC113273048 [Papaver somniferum]|uniref:uncharacterized protein LOC113273048 n=1 Tax=Papaver somniferum TaxID=3469 RepID=UPI000E6F5AD8|nr:uncharacterized protein LOC113273048 [Papaver somniferum]